MQDEEPLLPTGEECRRVLVDISLVCLQQHVFFLLVLSFEKDHFVAEVWLHDFFSVVKIKMLVIEFLLKHCHLLLQSSLVSNAFLF